MKTFFLSFLCAVIISSCTNPPTAKIESQPIYIKTVDVTGVDEKQVKKESISKVTDEYFECEMSLQTDGGYHAQKDLITPTSIKNFRAVFYTIVDKDEKEIHFLSSSELLNFMSNRGYEMVLEIPGEYGNSYRFKKKS